MSFQPAPKLALAAAFSLGLGISSLSAADVGEVDFNREIRPILSDKCYHCHGPDAKNQKSDFRIDTREEAMKDHSGVVGIVPGDLKASEVHWRIRMPNDDIDVMPPVDSNRVLTRHEKDLIDAWILQGANYDVHWSFKKPEKTELPELKEKANQEQVSNAIDHFIFSRLEEEKLTPQPEADLETRLRRASLTLTGLLPQPEALAKAHQGDPETAYEAFVDEALASLDYAERQTLRWLDGARYADTDGFQRDPERSNWPWRDWVIKAYHDNMPFDQFTIEQLAGDMLPDATDQQILATAFNRNHRQNSEAGALAEEYFIENVIDRVETTSTVWLGLTMGCARCHDHKYDPLSQMEFFQLFAYFNNIGERGTGNGVQANPVSQFRSPFASPPQELVTEYEAALKEQQEAAKGFNQRYQEWISMINTEATSPEESKWTRQKGLSRAEVLNAEGQLTLEEDGSWLFSGQNVAKPVYDLAFTPAAKKAVSAFRIDAIPHEEFGKPRQLARSHNGNFVLTQVTANIVNDKSGKSRPVAIARAVASFEQSGYPVSNTIDDKANTGWAVFGGNVGPATVSAYFVLEEPITLTENESLQIQLAHESRFANHNIGRFKLYLSSDEFPETFDRSSLPQPVQRALDIEEKVRSARERRTITDFYRGIDSLTRKANNRLNKANKALAEIGAESVPVMVMKERVGDPTPAYLLDRGAYDAADLNQPAERGVPAAFFNGTPEEQPKDRLELARWIVSEDNPLTARVIVNRIWQDHFGTGLVKTVEDFGAQSELPSHPELLDWLAVEFIESGWDVKALHKLIVTSAAYQQKSVVEPEVLETDPENRLLARGPRYRLDGFAIRDLALQSGGLLNPKVGGAPAKPYQPEGLWSTVAGRAGTKYTPDAGDQLYRKSLYTYWKRAVNPPRQLIFDAGGREMCNVSIRRTNTPLQALALMNDVTFVEAARHVAEEVILETDNDEERLAALYRRVTALSPNDIQLEVMRNNLAYFQEHFTARPEQASDFISVGESDRDDTIRGPEHAAWTAVAHLILNLDTSISLQ